MSLQSKVQALIAAANAKTGAADTDLTTAVQRLVDGYGGGATLISFNFSGATTGTYQAESGMTWGSWVYSSYNTVGAYLATDGAVVISSRRVWDGSTACSATDTIKSGVTYNVMVLNPSAP